MQFSKCIVWPCNAVAIERCRKKTYEEQNELKGIGSFVLTTVVERSFSGEI